VNNTGLDMPALLIERETLTDILRHLTHAEEEGGSEAVVPHSTSLRMPSKAEWIRRSPSSRSSAGQAMLRRW